MLRSMFTAISGLKNHLLRLEVIANNVSNLNTTGFKKERVNFYDILSQTVSGGARPTGTTGGINPKEIGLGMGVASVDTSFLQGSLQVTGVNTDLAIHGNGMFVLYDGENNYYTRAGTFSIDRDGSLVNAANGWYALGWQAGEGGRINTIAPPNKISVPTEATIPAKATTSILYISNLNASATGSIALSSNIQRVTDSVTGNSCDILWSLIPTGNFNEWTVRGVLQGGTWASSGTNTLTYTITVDDTTRQIATSTGPTPTDTINLTAAGGGAVTLNLLNVGDLLDNTLDDITVVGPNTADRSIGLTFTSAPTHSASISVYDSLGTSHQVTLTFTKTANNTWSWVASGAGITGGNGTLIFNSAGRLISSTVTAPITLNVPPAEAISITPDFSEVSQYTGSSDLIARTQNGYGVGKLVSFAVSDKGIITGAYSNGVKRSLAQIAIAHFANYDGLKKEGENMFSETPNSGLPLVGEAAEGAKGSILAGTLEMSNVDLAEEFVSIITTQRGFQANTRSITVADEILQELLALRR